MRKHNVTQKDILYLSMSMFFIIAIWVGSNIYHEHVTSTIAPDLQMQIVPISSSFDTKTIEELKNREQIDPIFQAARPTPPPSSTSAELTPAPEEVELDEPEIVIPTEEPLPTEEPIPTI